MTKQEQRVLLSQWNKHRGQIVLVIRDHVFATKKPSQVPKLIEKIVNRFGRRPLITYIPKADTLILSS